MVLIKEIVTFCMREDTINMNKKILSGIVHNIAVDIEKPLKADIDLLARWNNLTAIQRMNGFVG